MGYEEALSGVRELCVEHLGEHVGTQLAALARPGFDLKPADGGAAATGLCRWGGPAMLEPGTPWPVYAGVPLSMCTVLDVGALGPWLGDQMPSSGSALLNFFFLDPWTGFQELPKGVGFSFQDPRLCRVVPADPQRAIEVEAPEPAPRFDGVPLHARPVVTLPSAMTYDCDPVLHTLDYGDEIKGSPPWYEAAPGWFVVDRFGENAWPQYCQDEQGIEWGGMSHQAFGWPLISSSGVNELKDLSQDEPYALLLTLGGNDMWEWGDGGFLRFVTPARPLRDGDFSQVRVIPDDW